MHESHASTNNDFLPIQSERHMDRRASPPSRDSSVMNIFSRLPRELRNRIYIFCFEGSYDNEVIVRRAALGRTYRFTHLIREPCGQYSYRWIEDPVSACLSKKGWDFNLAREMLECYYWTRTFKFAHHEMCLLEPFLGTDGFGFGMTPAVYARRLQIQIQPLLFAFLLPDNRKIEEQRFCSAIEALGMIQTARTEIAIEVDLGQASLSDADYEHFLDAATKFTIQIQSLVDALKKKGLRISLRVIGSQLQFETRTNASESMATSSAALKSPALPMSQRSFHKALRY
ncbi:hypothetical protein COCMIDRAFT_92192 [Bipolaris oryzae ATCC 44560]|uniref:Uncharacterized protein n=1 Tax=Bipolaris oryzae ATCC 44560 TaxID=930090 RepID=W6Z9M0_COCMI|nr:uncharacterized protein COCMIDRAFT_92192 [Bipolaris oryzae ATCC 44560]EUC46690.1 hypothetical protein COCMIDRAFT_92192 [Bipolaris oryzae ATCC 44560]